jgi:hypothetical protein
LTVRGYLCQTVSENFSEKQANFSRNSSKYSEIAKNLECGSAFAKKPGTQGANALRRKPLKKASGLRKMVYADIKIDSLVPFGHLFL